MGNISRETFEQMDTDSKLNVLFDFAVDACEKAKIASEVADKLDKRISKGHRVDMFFAGTMGFIGGFVAIVGNFLFKKP